jgi:hypothetical protein
MGGGPVSGITDTEMALRYEPEKHTLSIPPGSFTHSLATKNSRQKLLAGSSMNGLSFPRDFKFRTKFQ